MTEKIKSVRGLAHGSDSIWCVKRTGFLLHDSFNNGRRCNLTTFQMRPCDARPVHADTFRQQHICYVYIDGALHWFDMPLKLEKYRYGCVYYHNDTRFWVACTPTLGMAVEGAYAMISQKQECDIFFRHINRLKIIEPLASFVPDDEYNSITGCSDRPHLTRNIPCAVNTLGEVAKSGEVIECVYEEMKRLFVEQLTDHCAVNSFGRSKCTGILEHLPGEREVIGDRSKNTIDFPSVSRLVEENGYPPLVSIFPKTGTYKKDGSMRNIYPMNLLLENVITRRCRAVPLENSFPRVHGLNTPPGFNKLYYYDVPNADLLLAPYAARLALELQKPWIYPYCYMPNTGKIKYLKQFPSGVRHTTTIMYCFVCAMLKHLGIREAYVQGDGVATPTLLASSRYLRRENDFNGFLYEDDGEPRYQRGHRLTEFKFLNGCGPSGRNKYIITRRAYLSLGATVPAGPIKVSCDSYTGDGPFCETCGTAKGYVSAKKIARRRRIVGPNAHIDDIPPDDEYAFWYAVAAAFSDIGFVCRMAAERAGCHVFDYRRSGWDSHPVKSSTGAVSSTRFPRTRLE